MTGTITNIQFTLHSFGEQRTTIRGEDGMETRYFTWWDWNEFDHGIKVGAVVEFHKKADVRISLGRSEMILSPCVYITGILKRAPEPQPAQK